MTHSKEIEALEKIISELEQIREMMYQAESRVAALEKEVSAIDEALPDDAVIDAMKPGRQKDGINRTLDLMKEAYDLVDELIGPPDSMQGADLDQAAILPEARGNDAISLEAALRKFNPGSPGGKNIAS